MVLLAILIGEGMYAYKLYFANPCDTPRTYGIGTIDPKFGISTTTVINYSKQAAEVWNKTYKNNPLLSYEESGADIIISFIYDERQRTTIRNAKLKREIAEDREDLTSKRATIDPLQSEYQSLQADVTRDTNAYKAHLATYNQEVEYWNKKGGVPASKYESFQQDQAALEKERLALTSLIARLNELARAINNYGADHNQEVNILNDKISDLNSSANRDFEQGWYDPNTKTITIYEYNSFLELKRVLSHELGHAIRMGHVENKESIMYPINERPNMVPTPEDLSALFNACKQKSLRDYLSRSLLFFSSFLL